MKKIFSLALCLSLLSFNSVFAEVLIDNLAESLDKNLKVVKQAPTIIQDDFALKSLNPNLKVQKAKPVEYIDEFALKTLPANLKVQQKQKVIIEDRLVNYIDKNNIKEVTSNKTVSSLMEGKIKVYPKKYYTTRTKLYEGDYIDFVLAQDVKLNNVLYKQGTNVKARVETLSQNGAYGVPADLIVGNFTLGDNVLGGQISKKGANRSIWVYPTAYILMPIFLVGVFILPIRGGHVKLRPSKIYEIDI